MNFYQPKEVSCKKTECGGHTRYPRGGGTPRGVGRALHPCGRLVSFPDRFLFSIFLNIPKQRKIAIRTILELVYLSYHVPIPLESETFWEVSLLYSSGITVSITLVSTFIGLPEI